MDISVVLVVLGAAFLHAFWNFQVRSTEDKALGMAAVMLLSVGFSFSLSSNADQSTINGLKKVIRSL